ncbi:33 kDa inner dynein arm light chain, axonemal-like [Parasteatoda tepidariorum]|uniref:33 kDa inner dynein arm light chain, axonemal-like n=1 Tax=Parasteatoda tepidariorum TaxID=114398 RepID=UPI001C721021|nr:33 kDa inner dynein arm light chain, axonemal-like [Parasteatoda tepidariorum]
MMELNEPPIIKYEQIPIEEDAEDKDLEEESSGSFDDDTMEESGPSENLLTSAMEEEKERVDSAKEENISRILDFTFIPRKIEKDGENYLLRLSRRPANRDEIIELSKTFDKVLKERRVRMKGFCPIRRELYDFLFGEF